MRKEVSMPSRPPSLRRFVGSRSASVQNVADWVMYRVALADAATSRGWSVHWFDARTVIATACEALRVENLDDYFLQARKSFGPPWTKDHKVATTAAISASLGSSQLR
jgi:hypothetical protein